MADVATARPPHIAPSAWLQPLPSCARLVFFGDEAAEQALLAVLGVHSPAATCRAASSGARSVLWLGPDERLLLAPDDERLELMASVEAALAGHAHSLVDVSQRQIGVELRGPQAVRLLNSQCPLDLALTAFPVGMCTRTIYAKAEIVLWRTAPDVFRVEVWRSFADYLVTLLQSVAQERAS